MTMISSAAPVLQPRTVAEAVDLRTRHPEAVVIAGGTDIMVYLESGTLNPPAFLNLRGVAALRGVERDGDGGVRIGALTTHTDLIRSPLLAAYPALTEACRTVGAVQIQNRGTLGGNIVNASPAGDTLPVLLALDAEFLLTGPAGTRTVPAAAFWTGYRRMDLARDELLTAILLPAPHPDDRAHFRKVGTRQAQSISKVVLGARLRLTGGVVSEARVAFGSVGPVPLRCPRTEEALIGAALSGADLSADLAAALAAALAADIAPIDDVRSTAAYRRAVALRTLQGFLASC